MNAFIGLQRVSCGRLVLGMCMCINNLRYILPHLPLWQDNNREKCFGTIEYGKHVAAFLTPPPLSHTYRSVSTMCTVHTTPRSYLPSHLTRAKKDIFLWEILSRAIVLTLFLSFYSTWGKQGAISKNKHYIL